MYCILSLKWTRKGDPYVTFWRTSNAGYIWTLKSRGERTVGLYSEEQVRADLPYYNDGENTMAIPVEVVDAMAVAIPDGVTDYPDAVAVPFTRGNLNKLKKAAPLPLAERYPATEAG